MQLVSLVSGRVACLGDPAVPESQSRSSKIASAVDAAKEPVASLQARAVVSPGQARHVVSRVGSSIAPRALISSAPMRRLAASCQRLALPA